jgi:hypothetical protein
LPNLRNYNRIYIEKLRKIMKNVGQDSRCPGPDSYRTPPGHKTEALPLEPSCSVRGKERER